MSTDAMTRSHIRRVCWLKGTMLHCPVIGVITHSGSSLMDLNVKRLTLKKAGVSSCLAQSERTASKSSVGSAEGLGRAQAYLTATIQLKRWPGAVRLL